MCPDETKGVMKCCHHCLYVLHGCLILLEDINHRACRNFLIRHAMFITESFTKMKMHAHINLVCACLITSNIISIINFYIMIQLQTQNCFFSSLKIEISLRLCDTHVWVKEKKSTWTELLISHLFL